MLFDFWGTVVETGVRPSPLKQVKFFLRDKREYGDFVEQFEQVFMTKSYANLNDAFKESVEALGLRIPEFVYDKLIGMWNKNSLLARPFPDAVEALTALQAAGIKLFLVTNSDQFSVPAVVDKFGLEKYFTNVYYSFQGGKLKTDKTMIAAILKEHKLAAKDVLFVGDSIDSDMRAATEAGIPGVLVDRRDTREYEPKITSLLALVDWKNE